MMNIFMKGIDGHECNDKLCEGDGEEEGVRGY